MRSPKEILFRIHQEARNFLLWSHAPRLRVPSPASGPLSPLPEPLAVAQQLTGSRFAASIAALAGQIRNHRLPLLGLTVDTGPDIRWRRDYVSGIETGTEYLRRIPYLDATRAGDHKMIWELNRHQHLALLAQAALFDHNQDDLEEIRRQLESWMDANPFQRGINWTSALEVAFRALSWIWIEHMAGSHFDPAFRTRFLHYLYLHGAHLEHNLSVYFSPNTHLLGEAVALHALGRLFPWFPGANRWRRRGAEVVRTQMFAQVRDDGSHFEQSTYYHVYAVDMFLFHAILEDPGAEYRAHLQQMAVYLHALLGPNGELAFIGDDDGGRFFHPYGSRKRFGRATLASCGVFFHRPEWVLSQEDLNEQAVWWLGSAALSVEPRAGRWESRRFENAGMAVLTAGDTHILFDAGPFGAGRAGHSHSDTLSLVVRSGEREILIDPGTYSYMDPVWRQRFRGSAAHNTIRVDEADQAVSISPFAWQDKPDVRWLEWSSSADRDIADAECRYGGIVHRRRLLFVKPDLLFVVDEIRGTHVQDTGEHTIEQFWHLGGEVRSAKARTMLVLAGPADWLEDGEFAWRSEAFGAKIPAPVMRLRRRTVLPCILPSALVLRKNTSCEIRSTATGAEFVIAGESYRVDL